MKWLIVIFLILLFAAGGFLAWYTFIREGEVQDLFVAPYPREALSLRNEVTIHTGRQDFTVISASTRQDLLFAQGLHHGKRGGTRLERLRDMFHGKPNTGPDKETARLAELFYYLDLAATAEESFPLYPIQIQELLKAYAKGLTEATGTETPWTVTDVLLMQRGYAFLMGRNLVREWSMNRLYRRAGNSAFDMLRYQPGEFDGLAANAAIGSALDALFDPLIETVRLSDKDRTLAVQTRTRPSLAFVFEPMVLEVQGAFLAEGLDLAGVPFLWSGTSNGRTWHLQPVMVDDERFFEFNKTAFLGRTDLLQTNENALYAGDYPNAPAHSPYGRNINTLIAGGDQMDIWYYWDGMRPSADLAALYYLLEASDNDAVMTGFQYHQVPAIELFLQSPQGHSMTAVCQPSNPAVAFVDRGANLFQGPTIHYNAVQAVRGSWFSRNQTMKLKLSSRQTTGDSPLDEALVNLLAFYLREDNDVQFLDSTIRNTFSSILKRRSEKRDFLIQRSWVAFDDWLRSEKVLRAPILDYARKRYILAGFGRGSEAQVVSLPLSRRSRIVADILAEIYRSWPDSITYPLQTHKGLENKSLPENIMVQSGDASAGVAFTGRGGRLVSVAGYTLMWQDELTYWAFPYPRSRALGKPKIGNTMKRKSDPHIIKPKR